MQLSTWSDYSIRVLMQAALRRPERVTVDEVAATYGISRHHLVKIVHDLGRNGYLTTQRGIGGGFTLARPPEEICLGDVVRLGEETESVITCRDVVRLGEETESVITCRDGEDRACRLLPCCRLKGVFDEAAAAFFAVLDHYTLADLVKQPAKMRTALAL